MPPDVGKVEIFGDQDEKIWGSMVKQALKRRNPGFNERAHGFRAFNDVLLEAEKRGLLTLSAAHVAVHGQSGRCATP